MAIERIATITDGDGQQIALQLIPDSPREWSSLFIDGVPYHIERLPVEELVTDYRVDTDPDYHPQSDYQGFCYILAPFDE
jgi:hypothetical protein